MKGLSITVDADITLRDANLGEKTGYFDSSKYQTIRRAEYSHVGEASETDDYRMAENDTYSLSSSTIKDYVPYLVAHYTNTYKEEIHNTKAAS